MILKNLSKLSRRHLFAGACLGAVAVMTSSQVNAQSTSPDQAGTSPASQASEGSAVDRDPSTSPNGNDVVVTGSLLRRTSTESPSPVTVLTADTLAKAGITSVSEAIRSISADSAGSISSGFYSGFSAGGAAVSLRGLGVSSTLVLVDGLRSANFPLNDDGRNSYVDLNSIPFSAVERVEVLKDGASSTYGADAIGGVVNVIMKKHFNGVAGGVESGVTERGDGARYRANLTAGYGDYETQGFNVYLNGEYQSDGHVAAKNRDFPFNTADLSSIGGKDRNTADDTLSTATVNAVVRRTTQSDLNDPRTGGIAATGQYTSLNLNCANGSYTVAGASGGIGCKHDNVYEYNQIQPEQQRYSLSGRLSIKLGDQVEGYVTGSYSNSRVNIERTPQAIRQTQPTGGPVSLASNNPGIVLPVYVCSAGVNCATAGDRRLNPNNPYAAAFAADPTNGAARIYYLFGDLKTGSNRENELYRATAGLKGRFGDDWAWQAEGVYAEDHLRFTQYGFLNIAGLLNAINTGSYNFVDPSRNTAAVRSSISPDVTTRPTTTLASFDASISKAITELPGGPLQVLVGGQIRRETQNTAQREHQPRHIQSEHRFGGGRHTVSAAFFELNAPLARQLEVDVSGRYDHYSEGFGHFSPKIGAKFTPIPQLAFRGTFSKGFRAPTFAESGASQYVGFSTFTPPASFQAVHGGVGTPDAYAQAYQLGQYVKGNPNLRPELSRSFTGGVIVQPAPWLSLTADYYNVRKTDIITGSPELGAARAAYFAGTPLPAGYSVNTVDAVDPAFPSALPRVLIINGIFENSASATTSGLDLAATATVPLASGVKFISRFEVTDILKYDLRPTAGAPVQKYVGTLGPYELSSGAGTPKWRGNWQNTLQSGPFALTATAYYVSGIKEVAADESPDLSCAANLYGLTNGSGEPFCHIKRFIDVDLNGQVAVNDRFSFSVTVENLFDASAPIAPAAYASTANYLPSWHSKGILGRAFRAGATFKL